MLNARRSNAKGSGPTPPTHVGSGGRWVLLGAGVKVLKDYLKPKAYYERATNQARLPPSLP